MRLSILACCLLLTGGAHADSTIDSAQRFAYSANGGWINWKWDTSAPRGAVVTETLLSGFIYSSNFGWIHLGNGSPANGHSYSQTGGEFGVNHDGAGQLSGLAYGSNIGWINFDWDATNHPSEPRIDLTTGAFSGYAYGANVGWIKLDASASVSLETDSLEIPDSDNDDIADGWERRNAGNLTKYNATSDSDGDGSSDLAEYQAGTDPENPSSRFTVSAAYTPGSNTFSVTFPSNPTRLYEIETQTSLSGWVDSGLGTFPASSGNSTTRLLPLTGNEPRRFFRVLAKVPLQP